VNFDEFPVRDETLEAAWEMTPDLERPRRVMILVAMRPSPGMEGRLEAFAREFVAATRRLPGALGSTLVLARGTLYLLERFTGEEAFGRHMASDYFARFQVEQAPLLAGPVEALFLER